MANLAELRTMYDNGQTEAVLAEIEKNPVSPGSEGSDDIVTLKGWCHYRRKEFEEAKKCAEAAGSHQWARELMAYLHAYAPKHKDDEALKRIADELGGDNINIANAFIIRARADDCALLVRDQVAKLADKFKDEGSVHAANLLHNAGRFFLAKNLFRFSVHYLEDAIERYGTDKNFHHRAAAHFWKSQAWEKLEQISEATTAMQESVRLWDEQIKLDPTNEAFAKSGDNAKKRLEELLAKKS